MKAPADDELPTLAIDREEIIQHVKRVAPANANANANALPAFRREHAIAAPPKPLTKMRAPASPGLPLALWVLLTICAGVASYHLAPTVVDEIKQLVAER